MNEMKKIASMFLMLVLVLSCVSANAEYLTVSDAESYAWDKDVDMVVVGFGLAGAATVIEAADIANDAEIVLLEKMSEPFSGGNSIASGQTMLSVWPEDESLFNEYLWEMGKPNNIPKE